MKRLHTHSQHFLRNPQYVKELIGHTTIKRTDIVYDIGAGTGIISSVLASRCKEVIAMEIDPRTAATLRQNTASYQNITVMEGDFLAMDLPATPYKIFANIPFHLSSAILRKITEDFNSPLASYLIVQKQFANKLLPDHGGFSSQLGMLLGIRFSIRIRKRLKRTDFWPFPNVDTVLIEITLRDQPLISRELQPAYCKFIETHFTVPELFAKLPLSQIGKTRVVKPSSLTLSEWLTLFHLTH